MQLNTLIISPDYPLPENVGGKMRTMNFARFYAKRGSVDLIYTSLTRADEQKSLFRNVYYLRRESPPRFKKNALLYSQNALSKIIFRRPGIINKWPRPSIQLFEETIASNDYDIIICRYIRNTLPLFKLPNRLQGRVVVDYDDLYSDSLLSVYFKNKQTLFSNIRTDLQKKLVLDYQKKCLDFGAAVFSSDDDLCKYKENATRSLKLSIPNIFLHEGNSFDKSTNGYGNFHNLLFVGNLNYKPNLEGLIWFIESVFQKLLAVDSRFSLRIVGRHPDDNFRKRFLVYPNTEVFLNAPELTSHYTWCGIVIVPLLSGGGTRIKILEAAFTNRPVISTQVGSYGLNLTDGKNILLFNDFESFSTAIEGLKDNQFYNSLHRNLRDYVQESFSLDNFEKTLNALTRHLLGQSV